MAAELTQDVDVVGHRLADAGALDLDRHVLAGEQAGAMHLRNARTAEGPPVELGEHLADRRAVLGLERRGHLVVGHGLNLGAQLRKLVAVVMRQDL